MAIRVTCSHCGKKIKAGDDWAGKKGQCPNCAAVVAFPFATAFFEHKLIGPPDDWLPDPLQKKPVVIDAMPPFEEPLAPPQITVTHHHKASGGAFSSGFGLALGCLAAFGVAGVLAIGGCIAIGVMMAPSVDRSMKEQRAEFNDQVSSGMDAIYQQVADDAVVQYEIAKRSGSATDAYVHAGMVAAAYLQAKDEGNYQKWKRIEASEAKRAGMPTF